MGVIYLGYIIRNSDSGICEDKGSCLLCADHTAEPGLYFHYSDCIVLPKSAMSSP